jgi:putative heme-binding domain-containing protein
MGSFQLRSWMNATAMGLLIPLLLPRSHGSLQGSDIEVPDGFVATLVAGDQLAHDAFSLTLDNKGRPVISGPGYIRTLIDDDEDGSFDRFVTWTNLPVQGAQGLWAEGNSVYWVGDKGLWRSEDTDGDLVSDTSPVQLLALPTGGEHDAHAIRRGPDGYWYLIVGNYAADIQKLANDQDAVVQKARAGTLWRISPDFSKRGVWAHGFRNAYDFDFLANGQMVVYDSDEEREVTLPWYRPTRVMVVSPGADAGWVDSAWFDSDHRVTMPQVISRLGRGSPTGVAVYHHHAFPTKYREAAFVLDWTFGRVIAVYPQPTDATEVSSKRGRFMAETFMQATGTAGFAPTDVCVDASGSLLVCVGGRGTSGGVYRVRYSGALDLEPTPTISDVDSNRSNFSTTFSKTQLDTLVSILSTPCPWDSWSFARWRAALDELPEEMLEAFLDGRLKIDSEDASEEGRWRRRAAQLLVYTARNPSLETLKAALASDCPITRSAVWWLIGHSSIDIPGEMVALWSEGSERSPDTHSSDVSPWDRLLGGLAWRQRQEAFGLRRWSSDASPMPSELDWQQRNAARQVQLWALSRSPNNAVRQVSSASAKSEPLDNLAARALYGSGGATIDAVLMDRLAQHVSGKSLASDPQAALESLTLLQTSLGDFRHFVPLQNAPPQIDATDGYRAMYSRKLPDKVREGWTQWCLSLLNPTNSPEQIVIETEVLRTIAMLEPSSKAVVEYCLSKIDADSHPTSDLHMLVVLACCKAPRDAAISKATASALPSLIVKVNKLGLNTDNSWTKRLEQIYKQLVQRDPAFPNYLVRDTAAMAASTLFWLEWCPENVQAVARAKVSNQLVSMPTKNWDADLVRFATKKSVDATLQRKIRSELVSPPTLIAIELLSKSPTQADYPWMLDSLANSTRDVWPLAWKGLSRMQAEKPVDEFRTLAILWAKLRNAPLAEISITSLATRLRSSAWKLRLQNVPTKENWDEWMVFFSKHLDKNSIAKLTELNGPPADWLPRVQESNSIAGNAAKGQALFQQAKCSQCHGSGNALGPSLTGIARRFSREDLFRAIYEPSRDIPDRYRSVKVLTTDGEVLVGMVVYESSDGITLQAADGKLLRINQANIENKSNSAISIMPGGLLDGATANQLADLYAYLKSL